MSRVVETDNFGGDYPNERFVSLVISTADAVQLAAELNSKGGDFDPRYFKVVNDDYVLAPPFEP